MPGILLLSSAIVDDYLSRTLPWWFRPIMLPAASHVYEDLRQTESFLRKHGDLATTIFIKPSGLSIDKQRGHRISLDDQQAFVSYLDLAAAMIEAANSPDGLYDMKNLSVINTGGSARFPPGTPWCIFFGLMRHFFPFLHPYLPTPGPE